MTERKQSTKTDPRSTFEALASLKMPDFEGIASELEQYEIRSVNVRMAVAEAVRALRFAASMSEPAYRKHFQAVHEVAVDNLVRAEKAEARLARIEVQLMNTASGLRSHAVTSLAPNVARTARSIARILETLLEQSSLHDEWQKRTRSAMAFLEEQGYRYCDTPACNCGSWHKS